MVFATVDATTTVTSTAVQASKVPVAIQDRSAISL